jgi:hypothetical protein
MDDLDRVLDRHDVRPAGPVDESDHRGDRGRLAGAGRAGHQHEPALGLAERLHDRRELELREGLAFARDLPDREGHRTPLAKDVHAEPAHPLERVGEVGVVGPRELVALVQRHQRLSDRLRLPAVQDRERGGQELAVDADERHVAGREVQVARTSFDRVAQQIGSIHRRVVPRG